MFTNKCYDQYDSPITNLTQWDSNVILHIHNYKYNSAPIVHFFTEESESSKTVRSTLSDGVVSVVVPNALLLSPGNLDICVFQYDNETDDGHVVRRYKLPIAAKPKPDDYEYVDNTEVIELSTLSIRLEALIAEAEGAVDTKIGELKEAYDDTVQSIRDDIEEDVAKLNKTISDNRDELKSDIDNALLTMLDTVSDGSPRGIFTDVAQLADSPSGVYLYVNPQSDDNGYIYWWDGETATKLLHYMGMIINDGTVTYEKLSDDLKKYVCETVLSYVLTAEGWNGLTQELDVSENYEVTSHTKANIEIGAAAYTQLVMDGCGGIYIQTNENNDNKLIAHALGNAPTADVTIQITLKEVK